MATREHLKKLKIDVLRSYAQDINVDVTKKKKEDIINDVLCKQTPLEALTPIQSSNLQNRENLPPFIAVHYILASFPIYGLKLSFSSIYDFMILRNREDGKSVQNFKGLDKSVRHYDAGDIQNLACAQVNEETMYFKGQCLASMKKQRYQVYVCLTTTDACTVDFAYCQCPIGLGQACSHIGGLLFAISNGQTKEQLGDQSCTSKPCVWKVPRSINQPAQPLHEMNQKSKSLDFDPRHSRDRHNDYSWTVAQLTELKSIFPQTGIAHLWQIPDEAPPAYAEEEVQTTVNPLQLEMEKMVYFDNNFPPTNITKELVDFIETKTRGQRLCPMWKQLHRGRITSSMFGNVLNAHRNPSSLIKQILEGSNLDRYSKLPEAVQWGRDKEEIARAQYIRTQKNTTVQSTGLTLCNTNSFLGASSDGRVIEKESSGLLEIKCPYSIRGRFVHCLPVQDILSLEAPEFCMEMTKSGPQLKRTHKYYAQVQGEMVIMGQPWCDFVVWTNAKSQNICIDRVYFDAEFVKVMMHKLVSFYTENIFPILYHDE